MYLQAGEEYAVVLLAECDDYEAFVSTTYGLILGKTDERVSAQPASGSLFLSQNGSTWTPKQNQNMAYRIYTAKFKESGRLNFFNQELPRMRHNTKRLTVDHNNNDRFRVNHVGHGLGVGDKIRLTGLDSTQEYFGVSGADMMDSNNVVDSADIAGYFTKLSDSFNQVAYFGADSATTNTSTNIDELKWTLMTREYPFTKINYEGSFVSGVSHSNIKNTATKDPRFNYSKRNSNLLPDIPLRFDTPMYLGNLDQETDEITPAGVRSPSIVIGANLSTTSRSKFGGQKASEAAKEGYVSDVSPIIDLTRNTLVARSFLVDNQPFTAAGNSEAHNMPAYYQPETTPKEGTAASKHLTKPIILSQAANGIRVFIDAYVPQQADIDLYYRTVPDADQDVYDFDFVRMDADYTPEKNKYSASTYDPLRLEYREYSYLIGGEDGELPDFTKFQLKVVFRSTNTCQVPVVKSIRAIAVI